MVVRSRSSTFFTSDEELGKRDDDHKTGAMGTWNIKHRPVWRKRRIVGVLAACVLVYLFVHYIPTDLGPPPGRRPYEQPGIPKDAARRDRMGRGPNDKQAEGERLPRTQQVLQTPGDITPSQQSQAFDGPVKFLSLAETLKAAQVRAPLSEDNKNVLFAASDLSSAAAIIPLACEMGDWNRNYVHFAIMGNNETPLDTIKQVNGAPAESCKVFWHDARPDYGTVSSHRRMEISVAGAIGHIGQFLRPETIITAGLDDEDSFFDVAVRRKVKEKGLTHIEVPKNDPAAVGWLARLDAASLHMWHAAQFDILVQAPRDASGSIMRLLRSLENADYTGFRPPRLILELSPKVDKATQAFLRGFQWPPRQYQISGARDNLIVRRRIAEQRVDIEEASLRFLESFYPASVAGPHVLLLSPQTELSPAYFHYLKAHLLEYKHSGHAFGTSRDVFGISLEAPSRFLNGTGFVLPDFGKDVLATVDYPDPRKGPFRWQAPNANAALYFADKWIEAHSFMTKRRSASYNAKARAYLEKQAQLMTNESPAWAEYLLEFMRNRGWSFHYPALPTARSPDTLAVVHNELYQAPEEFAEPKKSPTWANIPPSADSILTTRDDYLSSTQSSPRRVLNTESFLVQSFAPLLARPPAPRSASDVDALDDFWRYDPAAPQPLPRLNVLPLLDNTGASLHPDELLKRAEFVRIEYRQNAGGCSAARAASKEDEMYPFQAEDLFCFDERRAVEPPDLDEGISRASSSSRALLESARKDASVRFEGVARDIDSRVQDADRYRETAKAGFAAKAAERPATRPMAPVPRPPAPRRAEPQVPYNDFDDDDEDIPYMDDERLNAKDDANFHPQGVANVIDRVQDAEHYRETAKAGFAAKAAAVEEPQKRRPPPPPAAPQAARPKAAARPPPPRAYDSTEPIYATPPSYDEDDDEDYDFSRFPVVSPNEPALNTANAAEMALADVKAASERGRAAEKRVGANLKPAKAARPVPVKKRAGGHRIETPDGRTFDLE